MTNTILFFETIDLVGALIVLDLFLLAALILLVIALVISRRRKRYYNRIRLGSPDLRSSSEREVSSALRWIARILWALLIFAALALLLFFLGKLAVSMLAPITKGNLTEVTAEQEINTSPEINETRVVSSPELVLESANLSAGSQVSAVSYLSQTSPFFERVRNFMLNYIGYVIAGFIILLILISVISSRKQD